MTDIKNLEIDIESYSSTDLSKCGVYKYSEAGFKIGYNNKTKVPSISNEPKELPLTVDGEKTSVEVVNINGNNYVPIRSLAGATGAFEVDYKDGNVIVKTK